VVEADRIDPTTREKLDRKEELTDDDKQRNKNGCGAMARWLRDAVGLDLLAIVDSGGKSLHIWLSTPPPNILDELKIILPELYCDPALFKPSQPVRLPGAKRDGKFQSLLYFNPLQLSL
jgi:hypothetical protein